MADVAWEGGGKAHFELLTGRQETLALDSGGEIRGKLVLAPGSSRRIESATLMVVQTEACKGGVVKQPASATAGKSSSSSSSSSSSTTSSTSSSSTSASSSAAEVSSTARCLETVCWTRPEGTAPAPAKPTDPITIDVCVPLGNADGEEAASGLRASLPAILARRAPPSAPLRCTANFAANVEAAWSKWTLATVDGSPTYSIPFATQQTLVQEFSGSPHAASLLAQGQGHVPAKLVFDTMPWWEKGAAAVAAAVNAADFVTDVIVTVDFARAGDSWGLFGVSAAILVMFTLYSANGLRRQGRRLTAGLQLVGLGIVYETWELVWRGELRGLRVPLAAGAVHEYGTAAVKRLKLQEALWEATPELVIQCYAALRGELSTALVLSVLSSAASLAFTFVSSDVGSVASNAMDPSVAVPVAVPVPGRRQDEGVDDGGSGAGSENKAWVVSVPPGVSWKTQDAG